MQQQPPHREDMTAKIATLLEQADLIKPTLNQLATTLVDGYLKQDTPIKAYIYLDCLKQLDAKVYDAVVHKLYYRKIDMPDAWPKHLEW
jgi:hypothetical protein